MDWTWFHQLGQLEFWEGLLAGFEDLGPLVPILLAAVESFFPPLPLVAIVALNVAAHGGVLGFLYSWMGVAAGGTVMFLLWRRVVKRFFWKLASRSRKLERAQQWVNHFDTASLFMLALLPFTPTSFMHFAFGMSDMDEGHYLRTVLLGKGAMVGMMAVFGQSLLSSLRNPGYLVLAIAIKLDSHGPVFYRQVRVTQYGREFRIFKFRTMVQNADRIGSQVTVSGDSRITRVGKVIRSCRLDEIGQLLNVLGGSMSFVGTRPEVPKYVARYTPEMMATLLLPAGVTSEASIRYKDEAELLDKAEDVDETYVQQVLPGKMAYNLESIRHFGLGQELLTMLRTVKAVL